MWGIVKAFRRPPAECPRDRDGGLPSGSFLIRSFCKMQQNKVLLRLSDIVASGFRYPISLRQTLLAENLGKQSQWVPITETWYKYTVVDWRGGRIRGVINARYKAWLAKAVGRNALIAIAVGTATKVLAFLFAAYRPFYDEAGGAVSPLLPIRGGDISFYLKSMVLWFEKPMSELLGYFVHYYDGNILNPSGYVVSGPLYPALIKVTGYADGLTLPLALLFLLMAIAVQGAWAVWLSRRFGLGLFWLVCFALLPNPIWFMLRLSTDMLFAFVTAGFFFSYFAERTERNNILWICFLIAAVLIRPNALALVLFVAFDQTLLERRFLRWTNYVVFVLLICAAVLYLPYFAELMHRSDKHVAFLFFGHPQIAYLQGLFQDLPRFLDLPLSWLSLLVAKCLYFVGIRPSFAEMPMHIVAARAAVGVVLLPGLFAALVRGDNRLRAFLVFYCLPIFLGPTQERYNLAILPLLYGYGCLAISSTWRYNMVEGKAAIARHLTRRRPNRRTPKS